MERVVKIVLHRPVNRDAVEVTFIKYENGKGFSAEILDGLLVWHEFAPYALSRPTFTIAGRDDLNSAFVNALMSEFKQVATAWESQ